MKWTRLSVTHPGVDDDGIWFFWLEDQPGEVQIESRLRVRPFVVETDKHNEALRRCERPASGREGRGVAGD